MGNYFKMSNKVRDETSTIELPGSNIVFTRYLYLKDEVKLALLVSLLKKSDDAIFWAYELYYSGFKVELFEFIWNVYYLFYATLNPSFEAYLLNKKNEMLKDEKLVSAIVQDLIIRPFNTDVFFLNVICKTFEIECKYKVNNEYDFIDAEDCKSNSLNRKIKKVNIIKCMRNSSDLYEQLMLWIDAHDYRSIAQFILNDKNIKKNNLNPIFTNEYIYGYAIDTFISNFAGQKLAKKRLLKEFNSGEKSDIVLLAKIMTLFSIKEKLIKGKNFYITISPEEIVQYETILPTDELRVYRILQNACICGIDDLKHLSLFKLERDKLNKLGINLVNLYNNKWLYQASFSPLWFDRIKSHRGYVDYINQKVEFVDEELHQEFFAKYGYEPDEQPTNVKERSIMAIEKVNNWTAFYNTYNKNSLFKLDEEELEELNEDRIQIN
jgi:hypothetical protein